jgi:hypothetical protein
VQYFSVNFNFLSNDKSYSRDLFTIDTIDNGLSFHGIESVLWSNIFGLVLYTILRKRDSIKQASWSDQRARSARE